MGDGFDTLVLTVLLNGMAGIYLGFMTRETIPTSRVVQKKKQFRMNKNMGLFCAFQIGFFSCHV